ncbi:hypothetical protein HK097_002171 [Rhizophlyctis rosea]|uniref:Dopey N-terminal domain-containing protein n=1 Tax=Rhizophlyctis rosea TaxID=64517 RepID=A0AAD5SMZ9_9FUNG|nr:hypothetical protein HK097_002171 [Rhizophlyctis rosea]
MDRLSDTVGQGYFFHCIWLALITVPHLRLAGLHYLLKRMPTVSSREDVAVILGNETGLLAAALSATLEDKAVLVQRGALELLVQHFPLEYRLFKDDDLEAVIRSAVSVVSRRDMSLNRRLYSWLLGNTEENEKEKAAETPKHEKEIVMLLDNQEAVTNALRTMFLAGSNEAGDLTKPYKILISLMDKPEIGQTVLERLFFDILWSLREHCEKTDQKTELLQTAKMFFDMLDPFIVWKQVFHVVQRNDINDPESAEVWGHSLFRLSNDAEPNAIFQAYELLCYTLEHMRFNDDESQRVHIPYLLHTITSEITAVIGSELTPLPPTLNSSLILCADLLNGIATEAYETTWRLGDFVGENDGLPKLTIDTGREAKKDLVLKPGVLEEQIREFYGPEGSGQIRDDPFVVHKDFRAGQVVIDGAFVQLRRLLELFITEGVFGGEAVGGELFRIADVTGYMVGRLAEHMDAIGTKLRLEWATAARNGEAVETPDWITALLRGATESDVFGVVRMCIRCLLSAFRSPRYPIPLPKDYGAYNERTIRKLWKFLAPEDLAYHEEVTTLIWESTDVTSTYAVENVLSRLLGEESGKKRMVAMERFGVFWRFSVAEEKGKATSIAFSRPLFLVLDAIRSDDFAMQRAGEGWIRSLLDPLLSILLHRDISRKSATVRISGEDVPLLYYTSPFNLGQVEYAFANLAALVKVGDRGFLRRAWGGAVQVVAGIQVHGEDEDKMTYGDLLLDLGIRYLETEPSPHRAQLFAPRKMDAIHSRVCDFVQQFVVRSEKGQISSKVLTEMQDVLIRKLLFCIFSAKVDLQEKLLGLWKTTLAVGGISQGAAGREEKKDGKETAKLSIFIRTILEALSLKSNRPVLQSWIDFILFALPHFRTSVTTVLWPIIRCICEEIRKYQSSLSRYIRSFSRTSGSSEGFLGSSAVGDGKVDSEAPILLIALERIFAFCLENGLNSANGNRTNNGAGGDNSGLRALTGYVSSVVFGENERSDPEEELAQKKVREAVLMMTPGVLRVLEELYAVVYDLGAAFEGIGREVRDGCVRCLEVVYANYPVDALESVAEVWFAECGGVPDDQHAKLNNVTIRMIHAVPGCSQIDIVNMVVDSLRSRAAVSQGLPLKDKGRKLLRSPTLPDASLMLFLEKYCQRWADVQTVEDTWSSVLAYVRDSFVAPGAYKFMFPSMLRLMTVYFEKLIGRPAFEDRRVRREAEDAYQKVCDSCILIGGRAFEKGTWSGRAVPAVDVEGAAAEDAGGDFGGLAVLPEIAGTLKRASKLSEDTLMQEVIMYIATSVFPSLRKFLTEQDRVLALFTNAIYYIVGPNLKNRQNVRLLLTPILELICAMTKVPFGYKAWRKEAWEAFMDPRFFQMGLAAERKWRVIVQSEITNEKERIGELIGRISAAASSTLFVSKDQEALNRAHAVRRLSFAVFCGTRDQYVPQLPAIQEKLVDILKVSGGGVMHCEVFLCLRVLLRRISPKHLANIWPTVLSELIRLFGVYLRSQDGDKSEDLAVFFAACKFLDLLLVLGIEDFQW